VECCTRKLGASEEPALSEPQQNKYKAPATKREFTKGATAYRRPYKRLFSSTRKSSGGNNQRGKDSLAANLAALKMRMLRGETNPRSEIR
jgi:hypothetical protein